MTSTSSLLFDEGRPPAVRRGEGGVLLEGLKTTPLAPSLPFAEVTNVELASIAHIYDYGSPSDKSLLQKKLRHLLSLHGVLVFKSNSETQGEGTSKTTTPAELLSVVRAFGYHKESDKEINLGWNRPPAAVPGLPDVQVMGNCVYDAAAYGHAIEAEDITAVVPSDSPTGIAN